MEKENLRRFEVNGSLLSRTHIFLMVNCQVCNSYLEQAQFLVGAVDLIN